MFGFVNSVTNEIHVYVTEEDANLGARLMGLTRFTVRPVGVFPSGDDRRRHREGVERAARRERAAAAAPAGEMGAFLAMGR